MFRKLLTTLCLTVAAMSITVPAMAGNISEQEVNDTYAQATHMDLNIPMDGVISVYETRVDEDWYTFTITEEGLSYFRFGPSDDGDRDKIRSGWNVFLLDEHQNGILNWTGQTTAINKRLTLGPGKYYVRVCSKYNDSDRSTCRYQVKIDFAKDDIWEMDWNSGVKMMEVNKEYSGFLYKDTDEDNFYCPTVSSPARVLFTIDDNVSQGSIGSGWYVSVYDGNRNQIWSKSYVKTNLDLPDLKCANGIRIYVSSASSYDVPINCTYRVKVIGLSTGGSTGGGGTGDSKGGNSGGNSGASSTVTANATIKASKTTVKKGRKTNVKIVSNSGGKITVKAKSRNAKNKKYARIKNNKITILKKAPRGTYKFIVTSAAIGNYKETTKTIRIKVK